MNIELKLKEFSNWATELANDRKEAIDSELELEFEKSCSKFEKSFAKEEENRYNDAYKVARKKYHDYKIHATKEAHMELVRRREELLDGLFEEIRNVLRTFCESDKYKEYLTENLKEHSKSGVIQKIELYENHIKHSDLLKEALKDTSSKDLKIEEIVDNKNKGVGGYILYFDNNSVMDFTFNTKIKEIRQKNNFFMIEE